MEKCCSSPQSPPRLTSATRTLPLPWSSACVEQFAQLGFLFRFDDEFAQRQVDVVFSIAVQLRPVVGGQRFAVDPQQRVALAVGPLRQFFIDALAVDHQRRQQR